jgi:hypothetical protein
MTDKEIMIDGIDVSKCNFLGVEGICNSDSYFCEGHTNCYYKQLARKTQEYEQLQEKYEGLKLENEEGYEIVAELKNECEEFKKQLTQAMYLSEGTLRLYSDRKNIKYRKALNEIEKYFLKQCEIHKSSIGDYAVQNMCEQCEIKKNLNIINKAKDGKNE